MSNNLQILKLWAILEGISYLLLFGVSMPLKRIYNIPEPNFFVGMAHGVLFIAYCLWVLIVAREEKWNFKIIKPNAPIRSLKRNSSYYSKHPQLHT